LIFLPWLAVDDEPELDPELLPLSLLLPHAAYARAAAASNRAIELARKVLRCTCSSLVTPR
jgi:hypothetical protein